MQCYWHPRGCIKPMKTYFQHALIVANTNNASGHNHFKCFEGYVGVSPLSGIVPLKTPSKTEFSVEVEELSSNCPKLLNKQAVYFSLFNLDSATGWIKIATSIPSNKVKRRHREASNINYTHFESFWYPISNKSQNVHFVLQSQAQSKYWASHLSRTAVAGLRPRKCIAFVTETKALYFHMCRQQHGHRHKEIACLKLTFQFLEEVLDVSQIMQLYLSIFWPSSLPTHIHAYIHMSAICSNGFSLVWIKASSTSFNRFTQMEGLGGEIMFIRRGFSALSM